MKFVNLKKYFLYALVGCTALFSFPRQVEAQAPTPSFYASINVKEVMQGNTFRISFTLENEEGANFKPPPFRDFAVYGNRSQSSSVSIINGKMERSTTYSYTLLAKNTGTFEIGPASIEVNNQILKTQPVTLKVVKSNSAPASSEKSLNNSSEKIFIRAEISKNQTFIGEQLLLDYKLYTAVDVQNYSLISESPYQGFFVQPIRNFNNSPSREKVNGEEYTTKILKRVALFPQQQGSLKIEPFMLSVGIGARQGFFSVQPAQYVNISSNQVEINCNLAPEPQDSAFLGSIGASEVKVNYLARNLATSEAGKLIVEVSTSGDIKRIQPPRVEFPASFEVYGPKNLAEKAFEYQGEIRNQRLFEWTFIPAEAGNWPLPIYFPYLNPENETWQSVSIDSLYVVVEKGASSVQSSPFVFENETPPFDYSNQALSLTKNLKPFFDLRFLLLAILPVALTGLLFFKINVGVLLRKEKNTPEKITNPTEIRQRLSVISDTEAFFREVKNILLSQALTWIGTPVQQVSKSELRTLLLQQNIPQEKVDQFMNLLDKTEIALYGGLSIQGNREDVVNEVITLIKNG